MKKWLILVTIFVIVFVSITIYICYINKNKIVKKDDTDLLYKKISFERMKDMIKDQKMENYIILDVRTKEEFEEKSIPNALLIPDYEIEKILNEVPNKSTYIFVYCRSGNRSKTAAMKLLDMGYTNVYDVGGINDYPYNDIIIKK